MVDSINIFVKFGGNYDPYATAKCTAANCAVHGLMRIVDEIPEPSLLLYPFAETELSKNDAPFIERHGVSLIDAPWELLPQITSNIGDEVKRRKLPKVKEIQGPYKGSTLKINTAAAAASALFTIGFTEQANTILQIFPWKNEFITENFKKVI